MVPYLPNTMRHDFLQIGMIEQVVPAKWLTIITVLVCCACLLSAGAFLLFRRSEGWNTLSRPSRQSR